MKIPDQKSEVIYIRFFRYVRVGDGCWLWTGAKNRQGYGVFSEAGRASGTTLAPRYAWEFFRDVIPDGKCVLHKCDTPACVNPEHLFLGTRSDNNQDMIAKGRYRGGWGRWFADGKPHPRWSRP